MGEMYKNTRYICQLTIKYTDCQKMYQNFPLQSLPYWDSWYENIQSGNPDLEQMNENA
jgi:hypothetical protein